MSDIIAVIIGATSWLVLSEVHDSKCNGMYIMSCVIWGDSHSQRPILLVPWYRDRPASQPRDCAGRVDLPARERYQMDQLWDEVWPCGLGLPLIVPSCHIQRVAKNHERRHRLAKCECCPPPHPPVCSHIFDSLIHQIRNSCNKFKMRNTSPFSLLNLPFGSCWDAIFVHDLPSRVSMLDVSPCITIFASSPSNVQITIASLFRYSDAHNNGLVYRTTFLLFYSIDYYRYYQD